MSSKLISVSILAFLFGVAIRTLYEVPLVVVIWLVFIGLVLGVWWRRKSFAFSAPFIFSLSLIFIFTAIGIVRTEIHSWQFGISNLQSSVGENITIEGVVATEPDYRAKTVQIRLQTETDKILVSTDRLVNINYGDVIEVSGKLTEPESFATDLGRTFDYPNYLRAQGIEYQISFAQVEVKNSNSGNFVMSKLLEFKNYFISSLQKVIPEPMVGLGNGLLLGVKSALGDEIENDFRETGIIHIVVLSGYNIMLVVTFIMFCLSYLFALRNRIIFGILAIVAFAGVVGFSATVVRASIMAILVLCAQAFSRKYDVLRALLLAGVLMILINPYLLLYDIGFQLSFMATLGLILIIPKFEENSLLKKGILNWREFLFSTLATQIAVLPLLMYHIGQVSLISLLVNMLVLPMVPVAMLLTFITGILGLFSFTLASIIGYLATLSLAYILNIAHYFVLVPYAAVTVPEFSAFGVGVLYLLMIATWYWFDGRKTKLEQNQEWVIEDEVKEKVGEARSASPTKDDELPIFFR